MKACRKFYGTRKKLLICTWNWNKSMSKVLWNQKEVTDMHAHRNFFLFDVVLQLYMFCFCCSVEVHTRLASLQVQCCNSSFLVCPHCVSAQSYFQTASTQCDVDPVCVPHRANINLLQPASTQCDVDPVGVPHRATVKQPWPSVMYI